MSASSLPAKAIRSFASSTTRIPASTLKSRSPRAASALPHLINYSYIGKAVSLGDKFNIVVVNGIVGLHDPIPNPCCALQRLGLVPQFVVRQ